MEKYQVLKDSTFDDVLGLEPGQFKDQCIKRLIDCGFIKEKKQKFYKEGQRFKHGGECYILSRLAVNQVILINLKDGNAWHYGGCSVENTQKITEEKFLKITTGNKFKLE